MGRIASVHLLVMLLAAGCLLEPVDPESRPSSTVTPSRGGPYGLLAYQGFGSHYHDGVMTQGRDLIATRPEYERPSRCSAFRDNRTNARDACTISEPSRHVWQPTQGYSWQLEVVYKIHEGESAGFNMSAFSYDARGLHMGTWRGERHQNYSYVTE